MARVLGALVVGLLIGAIAGVLSHGLLFGDDGSIAPHSGRMKEISGASGTTSAATSDASPAIAPPAEAVRTVAASEASAAPPETVASFIEAARSAAPAEVRRGTKSIRGTIADRDGRPVAGVLVRTARQHEREPGRDHRRFGLPAPETVTLDEKVRAAVEEWYRWRGDWRETTCAADGRYVFSELREGRYWLEAWHDGFALEPKGETPVRADSTLDFLATPVVPVAIAVLLPDGSAAPKASIQIKRPGDKEAQRVETWTPGQAQLALADGEWELKATLGDPEQGPAWPDYLASKPQTIQASGPSSVTLHLESAPGVRGEVRFVGALPSEQLIVKLQQLAAGAEPDLKQLAYDATTYMWARNGEYAFTEVTPGRYVVGASRNGNGRIAVHAVVEIGRGMVVQDLEVPTLDPARCVAVRARGPDGRLLDTVSFVFDIANEDGTSSEGAESERQLDGSHLVPLDGLEEESDDDEAVFDRARGWPAETTVTLRVQSETFGEQAIVLASSTRKIEVDFGSPAKLVVTVTGYEGSGYEGRVFLVLEPPDREESTHRYFRQQESVATDGTQSFGPIAPGAWSLQLFITKKGGKGWHNSQVATIPLTLVTGDNHVSVAIPTLYSLTIAGRSDKGVSYWLSMDAPHFDLWTSQESNADGRVVFEDLVAGEYEIECDDGTGTMRVHVPTSGVVRFVAAPLNALRVWLEGSGTGLERIGFHGQDLVIAIDGKEYATADEMLTAISSSLASKQVVFTLLREGKRIDLTVETAALSNPFELGGRFEPDTR